MPKPGESVPPVRRALISVSDKTGVVELARALSECGAEILSTGGTARALAEADVPVTDVSAFTGFPEIMGGRVKTLHPKIHGALLGRRDADEDTMAQHDIAPIDLIAVNLYPFADTVARSDCTPAEAVEQIDIGGPAMLRAAAKNHDRVAVLTDPSQYEAVTGMLRAQGGVDAENRFRLAVAAFNHVTRYDAAISEYLSSIGPDGKRREFPDQAAGVFVRVADLRYGENPHQRAAFYRDPTPPPGTLATFHQHQGKPLSYNNILDADTAWECVRQFDAPTCVIVKHANPCGAGAADDPAAAYRHAFACDPASAFGGIIAFNRPLDAPAVEAVLENQFAEVLLAPELTPEAGDAAASKKNLRVLTVPPGDGRNRLDTRRVGGGLLMQTTDHVAVAAAELRSVGAREPTPEMFSDLLFAWRVVKFVKSNAVACARDGRTLGIGAGQTSRVMSVRVAVQKAVEAGHSLQDAVLASDAFFPFRDGLDAAADAGIRAVIQPAGSIRDREIITAADERGLVLVFAPNRHFRH